MPYSQYTPDEVVCLGESIYEESIRALVDPSRRGEHLVIDIESGDYAVDPDDAEATTKLLAKHPNAVIYGLRVGYPTAYTLDGHLNVEAP